MKVLERFLPASEEISLSGLIIEELAEIYETDFIRMKELLEDYSSYISRVNHPSKNTLYGMSKAIFFKYCFQLDALLWLQWKLHLSIEKK